MPPNRKQRHGNEYIWCRVHKLGRKLPGRPQNFGSDLPRLVDYLRRRQLTVAEWFSSPQDGYAEFFTATDDEVVLYVGDPTGGFLKPLPKQMRDRIDYDLAHAPGATPGVKRLLGRPALSPAGVHVVELQDGTRKRVRDEDVCVLWLRIGRKGEHENYGQDVDALISALREHHIRVRQWVDGQYGHAAGFIGFRSAQGTDVSLFWGDAEANFKHWLNLDDRDTVAAGLEREVNIP